MMKIGRFAGLKRKENKNSSKGANSAEQKKENSHIVIQKQKDIQKKTVLMEWIESLITSDQTGENTFDKQVPDLLRQRLTDWL